VLHEGPGFARHHAAFCGSSPVFTCTKSFRRRPCFAILFGNSLCDPRPVDE